eukprot:TRINITY_DN4659_c0_g1_i2.p1 TRINITY_DN4659_c0_g1~~TRINITY_DN4659_c0_g1_i2.p1  ORF type:complete len:774 (+),score=125.14 TRINITY_DN4659_c0_g1_i2:100-2322(+)
MDVPIGETISWVKQNLPAIVMKNRTMKDVKGIKMGDKELPSRTVINSEYEGQLLLIDSTSEGTKLSESSVLLESLVLHKSQQNRYSQLQEFYKCWKSKELKDSVESFELSFPVLPSQPKGCPDPEINHLLLLKDTLWCFDQINEDWNISPKKQYGYYIKGPNGIGKSISLYQIACLGRAMGFVVIYVPQCDIWVSQNTLLQADFYLFCEFYRGLLDDMREPAKIDNFTYKTLEDVLVDGLSAFANSDSELLSKVIGILFQEMGMFSKKPVLMIFDEINALFSLYAPKTTVLAYKHSSFIQASQLNLLSFQRGLKLLSGTGHQQYLLNAPSGTLIGRTRSFIPWSDEEFFFLLTFMQKSALLNKILLHTPQNILLPMIKTSIANIPRDLVEFLTSFDNYYELLEPSFTSKNPKDHLGLVLSYWESLKSESHKHCLNIFLKKEQFPRRICENILRVFRCDDSTSVDLSLLDLSLMYVHTVSGKDRVRIISRSASNAIRSVISSYLYPLDPSLEILHDFTKKNIDSDELGRAFERLVISVLLLNNQTILETTSIDNQQNEKLTIECSKAQVIFKEIPSGVVNEAILFIQQKKDFPISDAIIVSPDKVIVLQMTVGSIVHKVPTPNNSYSAIYDPHKLKTIVTAQKLEIPGHGDSLTFAESLMELTSNKSGPITRNENELVMKGNIPLKNFYYVIVSCQTYVEDPHYTNLAKQFPWVRVVYRDKLLSFLSEQVVNVLPDCKKPK